jgi:hypothetical protein
MATVQEQIQAEIQGRLANIDKYTPKEQATLKQAADRYGVVVPDHVGKPLTSQESAAPFLGNFLDQIGSNIGQGAQGLKNIWQSLTQKEQNPNPFPGTMNIPKMIGGMAQGAFEGQKEQYQQANQEAQTGHPLWSALRRAVTSMPVAGTDLMNVIDQTAGRGKYKESNLGGAAANLATMGAQYGGPEIMKALGAPERFAGKVLYEGKGGGKGAFSMGDEISLMDRKKVTAMGKELGVPVVGEKGIDFLGDTKKPDTFLGGLESDVQKGIAGVKNEKLNWNTILKPIQDEIDGIDSRAPGADARRNALIAERDKFKAANGWKPAQYDQQGNIIKPARSMNPITVQDGQDLKRTTYRLNSPSLYSDTAPLAPAEKAANVLHARGLKEAIEEKAPSVQAANSKMHTAIQLQDQLIQAEKDYPGFTKKWGRWMAGAGGMTIAGLGAGAEAAGHPMASLPFIAGALVNHAVTDPMVASRVGLALLHAGSDPLSVSLGLTPGAARTGQLLNPQPQPANSQ